MLTLLTTKFCAGYVEVSVKLLLCPVLFSSLTKAPVESLRGNLVGASSFILRAARSVSDEVTYMTSASGKEDTFTSTASPRVWPGTRGGRCRRRTLASPRARWWRLGLQLEEVSDAAGDGGGVPEASVSLFSQERDLVIRKRMLPVVTAWLASNWFSSCAMMLLNSARRPSDQSVKSWSWGRRGRDKAAIFLLAGIGMEEDGVLEFCHWSKTSPISSCQQLQYHLWDEGTAEPSFRTLLQRSRVNKHNARFSALNNS
jgi:hypothetical protein